MSYCRGVILLLLIGLAHLSAGAQQRAAILGADRAVAMWAERTGLSSSVVTQMWNLSGENQEYLPEDPRGLSGIDLIDSKSLATRRQILMVTWSGLGHCLTVSVFWRNRDEFRRVWQVSEAPGGSGFCRDGPLSNPVAFATRDGRVVIEIEQRLVDGTAAVAKRRYEYGWTRSTYILASDTLSRVPVQ